jgi:hypothetical protein
LTYWHEGWGWLFLFWLAFLHSKSNHGLLFLLVPLELPPLHYRLLSFA